MTGRNMSPLRYERRVVTAHHEAGHAVVAVHCGVTFDRVTIKASESSAGMLVGLRLLSGQEDDAIRIGLAGIMAMRLMYRRWQSGLFQRTRDDLDYAARSVMAMSNGSATLTWCIEDNARFITQRWGTVTSAARMLLQEEEIGYDAVLAVVASTARVRDAPPGGTSDWRLLTTRVLARGQRVQALDANDPFALAAERLRHR